jgi:flagellar motor switch protein FliM
LPSSHPVAVARFDVALGQVHGPIDLCFSIELARQLAERLASAVSADDMSPLPPDAVDEAASPETADQIARALEHSLVELRVELARTTATAGDLLHLAVGDIITTDQPADAPLVIELDGRPRFEARPGIHEGRKAIQIERPIDP